jgi:hypothetical protein
LIAVRGQQSRYDRQSPRSERSQETVAMRRRAIFASLAALAVTPASAQTPEEIEARTIETVRRFYEESRNQHNPEAARGLVADDYQPSSTVAAAPGIDAFIEREVLFHATYAASYPSYGWIEDAIVADGTVVVWKGVLRGRKPDPKPGEYPFENYPHLAWFTMNEQAQIVGMTFAPIFSAEWYGQIGAD